MVEIPGGGAVIGAGTSTDDGFDDTWLTGLVEPATEPEPWGDRDFDAWLEEMVVADTQATPRDATPRDAALVVSDAESAAITPGLIGELAAVDATSLDASGKVGLAVAWARVENFAAGQKAASVAVAGGPEPAPRARSTDFAWAEVGAALRLGDGESTTLVWVARVLADRLPATLAAMIRGDVSWRKARALVEGVAGLGREQARLVEERVLPHAGRRTPAQHQAAVRRAVDRLDPTAADRRRQQAKRDIALVREHHGDGMGSLFARMASEDVEIVWLAADAWARRAKAGGDPRSLDALRVAALVEWAQAFLSTGNPATRRPRRHGRPITINLTWDMTSFLGLTDHPGELLGPGVLIPPTAMRELLPDAHLRRLIYHPLTGHLLDATPFTVRPANPLAAYCALRDVTATTPTAGPTRTATAAGAGDLDHVIPRREGGPTVAANLHSPSRRWHRARTLGGWRVATNDDGSWTWTSPAGRSYRTAPHDYRLGP